MLQQATLARNVYPDMSYTMDYALRLVLLDTLEILTMEYVGLNVLQISMLMLLTQLHVFLVAH